MTNFIDRGKHEVITAELGNHCVWESERAGVAMEVLVLKSARWSLHATVGTEVSRLSEGSNIFIPEGARFKIENCAFAQPSVLKIFLYHE